MKYLRPEQFKVGMKILIKPSPSSDPLETRNYWTRDAITEIEKHLDKTILTLVSDFNVATGNIIALEDTKLIKTQLLIKNETIKN